MKTLSCDFCDAAIEGETFDEWMGAAKEHYGANHADKIAAASKEDKAKWHTDTKAKFDAT